MHQHNQSRVQDSRELADNSNRYSISVDPNQSNQRLSIGSRFSHKSKRSSKEVDGEQTQAINSSFTSRVGILLYQVLTSSPAVFFFGMLTVFTIYLT